MKTLVELKAEKVSAIKAMEALQNRVDGEKRSMSQDEQKAFDTYEADVSRVDAEIKSVEASETRYAKLQARKAEIATPETRVGSAQPSSEARNSRVEIVPARVRFGALKSFENTAAGEERAYRCGQWLAATFLGNRQAQRFCMENGIETRAAYAEGAVGTGGHVVPVEFSATLVNLTEQYGVFTKNARRVPMSRDVLEIPKLATHAAATYTAEAVGLSESEATFDIITLTAKKLGYVAYASTEVMADAAISIADMIASDFARGFALKIDESAFNGDGSNTYGGAYGLTQLIPDGSHAAALFSAAGGHNTLAELDHSDLAGALAKLPGYALAGAKIYCSAAAKALCFDRLGAIAGGNTGSTLGGAPSSSYLGLPIVVTQVLPSSSGDLATNVAILVGDMSQSSIYGDRQQIDFRTDNSIRFVEDQIALRATMRHCIANPNLGDNSVASPMVGIRMTA